MNTSTPSTMAKASGVRMTAGSRSNKMWSPVAARCWFRKARSRGRGGPLQAITACRHASAGIEFEHGLERRHRGCAHLLDHHLDHRGNVEETDPALQERLD